MVERNRWTIAPSRIVCASRTRPDVLARSPTVVAPIVARFRKKGTSMRKLVFSDLEKRISAISEEDATYSKGKIILA
ncbi:pantocin A family RiPP [Ensifer sp. BR816]|uniref:pantocin A family RiPP n=1 Tax=Rhizobium sp. (strain BR816) TaxID=1057002 RepID=UPI003527E8CE